MSLKIKSLMTSLLPNETSSIITAVVFFSLVILQNYDVINLGPQTLTTHATSQDHQESLKYTQPRSTHPKLSQSAGWASSDPNVKEVSPRLTYHTSAYRRGRYVSRPNTLSARILITHQDHSKLQCQAIILHPRAALTVGTCARDLSDGHWRLDGRARRSVTDIKSGRDNHVVKSMIHDQSKFALHILRAPLSVAPVYLSDAHLMIDDADFSADHTRYSRDHSNAHLANNLVKHAIYGPFVVSRPHLHSPLQTLSALYLDQQIKVLSTSDRIWMEGHLRQLSLL